MLPSFDERGCLPPGLHEADWSELKARFGWTPHRRRLLDGLLRALQNLRDAGCGTAYLDGSFVTSTERPADFDGCWETAGVAPAKVDPVLRTFAHKRVLQKMKYRGELFPASASADRLGNAFIDFFQTDKATGDPKGIVVIYLKDLPR